MERELHARGMVPAYPCIVTVHGEVLHNNDYHHPLREGDLLLADVGGEYHGWASDVTRTWPVSGTFTPTQRALYDIVLQSQLDANRDGQARHALPRRARTGVPHPGPGVGG